MWDIYKDKFISSDYEYEAVLICIGLIHYDYAYSKSKELYDSLTEEDKEYIINKFK